MPRKKAEARALVATPDAKPIKAQELAGEAAAVQETVSRSVTGFPIVGVGASAGGLAAFEAFFSGMPTHTDPGMAFVLVQHLAPDHKSILTDLIRRYTRMEVFEVEDGMVVKPNCAYIIPPNRDMALLNGALQLMEPFAPRGQRLPIDFFFRSLAQDQRERAICIVLSGTGSDGALGVRAVKNEGGMVMAQTPDSTEYDGMPRSAISTGLVDYELQPTEMPAQLIAYVAHAFGKPPHLAVGPGAKVENAMKKISILLRAQTGHDFSQYKPSTFRRRIERRMAVQQLETLDGYVKCLQQTAAEVEALFHDLLIGVTSFFRDPKAFKALEEQVIPKLFAGKPAGAMIRVWSPGCSTGEEAYSLAVLLQESLEASKQTYRVQVFATDIDRRAIATARAGLYPASIASDISPERLARFFTRDGDGSTYRVHKGIRDMLVFSEQDLIKDPPFSKIDLISCRNLLIYMNRDLQKKIIPLFHYALNPDGFLFMGTSETIGEFADLFSALDRKLRLYQRKVDISDPPSAAPGRLLPCMMAIDAAFPRTAEKKTGPATPSLRELTEQALLQQVAPAGALVNHQGDILYLHGRTGVYVEPAAGEAGVNNILKMAREGLRRELTTALRKAVSGKEIVHRPGLRVKTNGEFTTVNLTVCPVAPAPTATPEARMYLVILEQATAREHKLAEKAAALNACAGANLPDNADADARIAALMQDLQAKEEYLQTANEELETSNEELKSSNEELQSVNEEAQSTNEELETSKEELQSVNEELATVNAELQTKVADLSRVNNDMNNLMAGTGIATIFVDHQLRILRFTPTATRIINLIQSDVRRPVGHIVSNLTGYDRLVADAQAVLDTLVPKEVEVQTTEGTWYTLRILPYRTLDNVIEGAVITFVDIMELKLAERALARLNHELDLKNRELESILYVASHDLWSPLVNIKGFTAELNQACRTVHSLVAEARSTDELRAQLATPIGEVVPRALEFIGAGVTKMDTLLAGLLRLSRVGQAALQLEPLDMNAMLAEIARAFEFQIRQKGATVQVGPLPPCFGDATQINQVFSNLLDNALKYLDPARPGAIRIHGQQDKQRTTYCVEDNGIGIAPEDQDRVFEVFHRVHPKGPVTGEGLGLAAVRRALDRQEGTVRIESEPGKGSRFFVSLPTEAK